MFGDYNSYPWMMIIPLALVCLLAFLVSRLIGKQGQQFTQGKYIQIKDRLLVGKDKNIIIIEAGNRYYLVGVTNQSIQLLSEIEEDELVPIKARSGHTENTAGGRGALFQLFEQARGIKNAPVELQKARKAARDAKSKGDFNNDSEYNGAGHDEPEHGNTEQGDTEHGNTEYGNTEHFAEAGQHDNKRLRFAPKAARRDNTRGGDCVTIIDTIPIPEELENEFERQLYEAEKNYDDGGVYVDVSSAVGFANTQAEDSVDASATAEEAVIVKKGLFAKLQKKEAPTQQEEDDIDRMLLSIGQRTAKLREKRFKDKEDDIEDQ